MRPFHPSWTALRCIWDRMLVRISDQWRPAASLELSWPARAALALLLIGGASVFFGASLSRLLAHRPEHLAHLDENFNEGYLLHPEWVRVSGLSPCRYGWCLPSGGSGWLAYRADIERDVAREIHLHLWFYLPAGATNRLQISGDGGRSFRTIQENFHTAGGRVILRRNLTEGLNPPQPLVLLFEARNSSPHQVLILDKLSLTYLSAFSLPLPSRTEFLLAFLCYGLAGVVLCRRWSVALCSLLIVAGGAALRYGVLVQQLDIPLDPDAQMYRLYAHRMLLFSETGFFSARFNEREPMFILVIHAFFKLIGESDHHLRLVTFILSIAVIWAVIRVGRTMLGGAAGWLAGIVLATNLPLILESGRGLRLELEMIILLLYIFCAFIWKRPKGMQKAFLLGGIGGLLLLTRSTYLPALLPLQVLAHYGQAVDRTQWLKNAAVAVLLMIALVIPHRYSMYKIHGDPFWDTTGYARWNANFEFTGRPGFPTREQLNINPYVGPRITYWHYMFGMHTVGEVISGTIRGYIKLFGNLRQCTGEWRWSGRWSLPCSLVTTSLQLLGALGLALAALNRQYLWLPIAFIFTELPVAFLFDRGLVEPYRHSFQGFPLVLFAGAFAVMWGIRMVKTSPLFLRQGPTSNSIGSESRSRGSPQ